MSDIRIQSEKGVSLYLALLIMIILLAMALGISTILVSQIRIIKSMGDSVVAFYAADTGIENALYYRYDPGIYIGYLDLNNNYQPDEDDSTYEISVIAPGADCSAPNYCIKSVGTFRETKRAIEVTL